MEIEFQWPQPGWETVRKTGEDRFGTLWEIRRERSGSTETCTARYLRVPDSDAELEQMRREGISGDDIAQRLSDRAWGLVNNYKLTGRLKDCNHVAVCKDVKCIRHEEDPGWDVYIRTEPLQPLLRYLDEHPEWSGADTVRLGRELSSALAVCEDRKTAHRCISPESVYVASDGRFLLGDFDVSRALGKTEVGDMDVFPAPEQYRGETGDERSDQYSLGVLLCWLLNGRKLPGGELAVPACTNPALRNVIQTACAWDPNLRYPSAAALLAALQDPELDRVGEAVPDSPEEPGQPEPAQEETGQQGSAEDDSDGAISRQGNQTGASWYVPEQDNGQNGAAQGNGPEESGQQNGQNGSAQSARTDDSEREEDETPDGEENGQSGSSQGQGRNVSGQGNNPGGAHLPPEGPAGGREETPPPPPKKRKKGWPWVLLVLLAALAVCYFTVHIWEPASCDTPETCKICHKTRGEAPGHVWGEWTEIRKAGCDQAGEEQRICANDASHVETRAIPATGHSWSDPVYTWAEDYSSVTARRICANDPTHVEELTVEAVSEENAAPTRESAGRVTYTATFSSPGFATQSKTVTVPALGYEGGRWVQLRMTHYYKGEMDWWTENVYGPHGTEEYTNFDEDSYERTVLEFDSSGRNTGRTDYDVNTGKIVQTAAYSYDANGYREREDVFDPNGNLLSYTLYKRPEEGVTEMYTYKNGKLSYYSKRQVDENDNMLYSYSEGYQASGDFDYSFESFYTYVFNSDGTVKTQAEKQYWVSSSGYSDVTDYTTDYTYDGGGLLMREVWDTGSNVYTTDYTYDAFGNCLSENTVSDGEQMWRYEYEYGYLLDGKIVTP